MGRWEVREVGRPDVSLEAPWVVLRWGVLLPEVLMMVRRVGLMEALRVGLTASSRVGLLVGQNGFPVGRVEGLRSCF